MSLRVGTGVDAHAFEDGVPLVLGGVAFKSARGLAGHSDGDVITHALIDAVLGAAGLGDIGSLFPSDASTPVGISSLDLLRDAVARVREAGYAVVNADCVLIGEEPRISSSIRAARPCDWRSGRTEIASAESTVGSRPLSNARRNASSHPAGRSSSVPSHGVGTECNSATSSSPSSKPSWKFGKSSYSRPQYLFPGTLFCRYSGNVCCDKTS